MPDEDVSLGNPRHYTREDRVHQLTHPVQACRRAGQLFVENGYREVGETYLDLADVAEATVVGSFQQDDLRPLARVEPRLPEWLHPKYLDFDAPRQSWQDAAAEAVQHIQRTQLELRALATYDRS